MSDTNDQANRKQFLQRCKEHGQSPVQVLAWMSLGVPLETALQTKERRRIVLIQINGQTKSMSAWCRQNGIASPTVRKRIEAGFTLEEAFESGKYKTHKIRVAERKQEREYTITKPFLSWCQDYLIDPIRIRAAMSMGYGLEYALKHANKGQINQLVMQVQGKTETFLRLCAQYGKASNTIRRRVSLGLPLEDAFVLPAFKKGEMERLLEMGTANEPHSVTQPLSV